MLSELTHTSSIAPIRRLAALPPHKKQEDLAQIWGTLKTYIQNMLDITEA